MSADFTGKFCRKRALILSSFRSLPFPKQNNILCLGVIPKGTESGKNYKITWDDLMSSYKNCGKEGCECCQRVMQLLGNAEVQQYLRSRKFREGKVPVETAKRLGREKD